MPGAAGERGQIGMLGPQGERGEAGRSGPQDSKVRLDCKDRPAPNVCADERFIITRQLRHAP